MLLRIHVYRKAGFELDRDPVIVDRDLLDHSSDEYLAVFRLAGLFLNEQESVEPRQNS